MNISQIGLEIIKKYEGFNSEKYICPAGKWTIGYGHSIQPGEDLKTITKEDAEKLLLKDIKSIEFAITRLVLEPLTQGQFDALVSLVYNWGGGKFMRSKGLKKLNKGNYQGAEAEFFKDPALMGIKGGKPLPGLVARRAEEDRRWNAA